MRLITSAGIGLVSASFLSFLGKDLVEAQGTTCADNLFANPVDISIGKDISCGVVPGGVLSCWRTGTNEALSISFGSYASDDTDNIVKVLNNAGYITYSWIDPTTMAILGHNRWGNYWEHVTLSRELVCLAYHDTSEEWVGVWCTRLDWNWKHEWEHTPAIEIEGDFHDFFSNSASGHVCRRFQDGKVDCIGRNDQGQASPTRTEQHLESWDVDQLSPVLLHSKSIAMGTSHTCAIKQDNTIWCWGKGYTGVPGALVDEPVQVHEGDGVPRAMVAGDDFTCYITNNALKCFTSGSLPVQVDVGGHSVYTAWAAHNQVCVQINDDTTIYGSTECFTVSTDSDTLGGSIVTVSNMALAPVGCAPNENCFTTVGIDFINGNRLTKIPIDFDDYASVEGADDDSYFGLPYQFFPEQFTPPGMHTAMFMYIVPTTLYLADNPGAIDAHVNLHNCVLSLSDSPFTTRVNKKCFDVIKTATQDVYNAKLILRTCIVSECTTYTHASEIFDQLGVDASAIFSSVSALDNLTQCPYVSRLDFTVTADVGNLVETTQRIELNWARDDVTKALDDNAESATAINDDLGEPVLWAICDRALNTGVGEGGYSFVQCLNNAISPEGNSRVVQLSKTGASTDIEIEYNQLAIAFQLAENDRRLVSNGYLDLIPEKTTLNLFHADYPSGALKTGATCSLSNKCTQVYFKDSLSSLALGDYTRYTEGNPPSDGAFEKYQVAFRGNLPEFTADMMCGIPPGTPNLGTARFCSIVMELTFAMGPLPTSRRLVQRQISLPMRMLGDGAGNDYNVALATADEHDKALTDTNTDTKTVLTQAVPAAGGMLVVAVGVALFMRRNRKDEEDDTPSKKDLEANGRGSSMNMA